MSGYVPKPGDIGLTQIRGLTGKAIRLAQFLNGDGYADYEHAFVYVASLSDMIMEAEPEGARFASLRSYDVSRIAWIPAPADKGKEIATNAALLYGTPYSFVDYLALALVRLRIPSKRLRAYVLRSDRMICSQLAAEAWHRAGVELFTDGRPPQAVTPGALVAIARQRGVMPK